jgi:hypothetical protein
VFRPGTGFDVKFLPVLISHGAYGHVRQAIAEGKRENIDFSNLSVEYLFFDIRLERAIGFFPELPTPTG